jgi:hypothetical protein
MSSALIGQLAVADANKADSDLLISNGDCVCDGDVAAGLAKDLQVEIDERIETSKDLGGRFLTQKANWGTREQSTPNNDKCFLNE